MNTDWGTFLANYEAHFAVKFDEKERLKYFGTSDIDAIVEIVRGYGVTNVVYKSSNISSLAPSLINCSSPTIV